MYLLSVNSSKPSCPPSRPMPRCLTPPNGAAGSETKPGSSRHARLQRFGDAQPAGQITGVDVRHRSYSVSFAVAIASDSSSK